MFRVLITGSNPITLIIEITTAGLHYLVSYCMRQSKHKVHVNVDRSIPYQKSKLLA